jgi:hypothetical protein
MISSSPGAWFQLVSLDARLLAFVSMLRLRIGAFEMQLHAWKGMEQRLGYWA